MAQQRGKIENVALLGNRAGINACPVAPVLGHRLGLGRGRTNLFRFGSPLESGERLLLEVVEALRYLAGLDGRSGSGHGMGGFLV